ncbi:sialate O-acetylesterase [Butyrivibrio sp. YAB3001]|uniref:sialate O-acetylesterase n=1 Tax=Butyrivibrio sp. YAB3001 TaxID=1520812 RepID=UPI0008F67CFE|nr:sialate O-acetylesterase [Butyrivibrio sp. YAB3001]SFC21826.1 sialate O-acetylesterase [Butyrivibrio sp. YAB3001]
MSELRLPRLLSDGAVLQRRKSIHVWGWDEAGAKISVKLVDGNDEALSQATGECNEKGRFDVYLPARESGGPYKLVISDEKEKVVVNDVMIGIVWFCTGQSNMELPIIRVKDKYPEMLNVEPNDRIRTFKIMEETCYKGEYEEHHTGDWKSVSQDTIMNFSATGYFFAKNLQKITGQTVGFINASLGGSNIWSWMSREMLEGYDELLSLADKYADDKFVESQIKKNIEQGNAWRGSLYQNDEGIKNHWEADEYISRILAEDGEGASQNADDEKNLWNEFSIPNFFEGTELDGFIGSVWFARKFDLPKELAGKSARLFLGTMVDNDIVFVNGVKVGDTGYQYPPRKYDIPEGLTREKDNTIVIRLGVETGKGRFTPDKDYKFFNEDAEVKLDGTWKYRIGAKCEQIPETDFISWKPTGLYNAMTAPCHNYPIDGVLWYQGESNIEDFEYEDLTRRQVEGYRKAWGDESIPFIGVQLPNFVIDQLPRVDDWGKFRLIQNKLLDIENTGLVVTLGLGEDNDLHPVTKEPIGERAALWASHLKYCYNGEYMGPAAISATGVIGKNGKPVISVTLDHADEVSVLNAGKGTEIKDMYIVDDNGVKHQAKVTICENTEDGHASFEDGSEKESEQIAGNAKIRKKYTLELECDECAGSASKVQWCCRNTYQGGLITNETGIPMSPFELPITERM